MRVRRHFESFEGFKIDRRFWVWLGIGGATILAGYLTAYLVLFPAPILRGHQAVPRVLGLSIVEAQAEIQKSKLQAADGGAEPHPSATQGVVIWQDPPPGVIAPEGTKVTLVSSAGPPKIPIPDVANLDAALAWCNGSVTSSIIEGKLFHVPVGPRNTRRTTVLHVAHIGDWIVKQADDFYVLTDEEFKARYEEIKAVKAETKTAEIKS